MENNNNQQNNTPLYLTNIGSLVLAVLFAFAWSYFVYETNHKNPKSDKFSEKSVLVEQANTEMFDRLELEGNAAIIWDATNKKILFSVNETDQLPLASLTKLMTALVASEILPPYFSIDNPDPIKDKWSLGDITSFVLVTSSNNAASAIASAVNSVLKNNQREDEVCAPEENCDFINLMNEKAKQLGLSQTYFTNPTGLDNDFNSSGGYGSAKDIAELLTYIYEKNSGLLEPTTKSRYLTVNKNGIEVFVNNTNQAVDLIPGILGSKTGFTDFAGGNLAIILDAGFDEPYVFVIMGSSEEGRFEDMSKMISSAREYFAVNGGARN